jgi:monooxygenase
VEHVDVLIVGAGLSGIGAADHLQDKCPGRSYAIVEARETSGGTWDLFRYPGVRSDSDMFTLGYRLRPWTGGKTIADGRSILEYVRRTAAEQGIDRHIRYGQRVISADFCTATGRWTVQLRSPDGVHTQMSCGFLYCCSGYYSYEKGFTPQWPGVESFGGQLVHPQQWPEDLDHVGKRVVVIGSGATAMTLVPALARTAKLVTMLQRSPSYVVALPDTDSLGDAVRRLLPATPAFLFVRWKNVLVSFVGYQLSRRWPGIMKKALLKGVRSRLPAGFDVDTHFTPRYQPWDQRLCVVPNGDLFKAISEQQADIVTGEIQTFTPTGLRLRSGVQLTADIIVTATGLDLLALGGMALAVDGLAIDLPATLAYKSQMLAGVPNFAFAIGYTNASWTLKVDLTSEYVCRLLNYMQTAGYASAVPVLDPAVETGPFMDFQAGYVLRAIDKFPRQGARLPWRVTMNYLRDLPALRHGSVTDDMRFSTSTGQ